MQHIVVIDCKERVGEREERRGEFEGEFEGGKSAHVLRRGF